MQYNKSEIFAREIYPMIQELVAACAAAGVPIMIEACYSVAEDEAGECEAGRFFAGYMPKEITPVQMTVAAAVAAADPQAAQKAYDALTGKALSLDFARRVESEVEKQVERILSKLN